MKSFFHTSDVHVKNLEACCARETTREEFPLAGAVEKGILIYEGAELLHRLDDKVGQEQVAGEIHRALAEGPGVVVFKRAFQDESVLDASNEIFYQIIKEEKEAGLTGGDHFGQNERIWNALQKTCMRNPEVFLQYYGNPLIALASRSWLGPGYQVTAQVNNVKPGSTAQAPHRDYHLGFQSDHVVAQFPARLQVASQYLTLQGAVAHVDMPLESGPTLFLPHSQKYHAGYVSYRQPAFVEYFNTHAVQLPLEKGDAVFFSPALFHGAGSNQSDTDRLANLLQVSVAFGRTMESLDRIAMIQASYEVLLDGVSANRISGSESAHMIAVLADGYAFPTNLDRDPPIGGHAPATQQALLAQALEEKWSLDRLNEALRVNQKNRRSH